MNGVTARAFADEMEKISSAFCKRCGKVHAPVCNKCGGKDGDFRSMHGPCDRCVFQEKTAAGKDAPKNRVSTRTKALAVRAQTDGGGATPGYWVGRHLDHKALAKEASELLKVAGLGSWAKTLPTRLREDAVGTIKDVRHPIQGIKKGWRTQTGTMGVASKALFGLGAYSGGKAALAKDDPSGKGRSKVERTGRFLGSTALGVIGLSHYRALGGIPVGIAAGIAGEEVGGLGGKVVDKIRGYRPQTAVGLPPGQNPQARVSTAPY